MVLQLVPVDIHQREAVDLLLSGVCEEGIQGTIGDLQVPDFIVEREKIVLQIAFGSVAFRPARFDDCHRVRTSRFKYFYP